MEGVEGGGLGRSRATEMCQARPNRVSGFRKKSNVTRTLRFHLAVDFKRAVTILSDCKQGL